MAKQTKTQIFRDKATHDQWKELYDFYKDYEGSPAERDAAFKGKYGFTYGAVKADLERVGLIKTESQSIQIVNESKKPIFTIGIEDMKKEDEIRKTDIYFASIENRFNKMCDDYYSYQRKAIFNKLMSEVLSKYGY